MHKIAVSIAVHRLADGRGIGRADERQSRRPRIGSPTRRIAVRTRSASPGRKHRAAVILPERSPRHRARQSPQRRHRGTSSTSWQPVPMRSWSSHLVDIAGCRSPLEQSRGDAQYPEPRTSSTATACPRSGAGTPVRGAPREYRARALARTNASTSMIFGPRCQSWRDTRFWPRRKASRLACVGIGELLPQPAPRAGEHA